MSFKAKIQQLAFRNHMKIEKLGSNDELLNFISRFREHFISCDLIRVGGDGDGGYLHPPNLNKISYCFSPGVNDIADFEKHLSDEYGIKSFMADASVKEPPISDENFDFLPKFLGSRSEDGFITLSDWMSGKLGEKSGEKILQIDIEGGEYPVLIYESPSTLANFSTMIVEFHDFHRLYEKTFLRMVSAVFEKIYENFSICHVHPNNCCGVAELDGISVPRVIEVTFIRNDQLVKYKNGKQIALPHPLDKKNVKENDELLMPEIWWKR